MRSPRFKKWFASLPALNQPQRRQVLAALHPAAGLDQLLTLLDQGERRCPDCPARSGTGMAGPTACNATAAASAGASSTT